MPLTPEQVALAGSESAHQIALFTAISLSGNPLLKQAFAIPNGGLRDKRTASRMKAEGARAGVWDIFLPVPRRSVHGLWVEMKVKPNNLTPEQRDFWAIHNSKFDWFVAFDWQEALAAMTKYLGE